MKFLSSTRVTSRRGLLVLFTVALATLIAILFFRYQQGPKFYMEPGKEYRYRFSLQSEELIVAEQGSMLAKIGMGDIGTTTSFEAQLTLRCLSHTNEGYLVAASLSEPEAHLIKINDRELIPDRLSFDAIFEKQSLFMQVAEDGTVGALFFAPAATGVFKRLMRNILGEMQLSLRQTGEWSAREQNRRGPYTAHYRKSGGLFFSEAVIEKRWEQYHELLPAKTGSGDVEVSALFSLVPAPDGYCRSLKGEERTVAYSADGREVYRYTGELELIFLREGSFSPQPLSFDELRTKYEKAAFSAPLPDREAERENFRKMAAMLSIEELESLLAQVNSGEMLSQEAITDLLRRAHGLLGLHPELSDRLAAIFEKEQMHSMPRKLILTILTSHSFPETQAAVRKILTGEAAKNDPSFIMMLQSASAIASPEKETIELVTGCLEKEQGEKRHAAAYTLGAMVQNLKGDGRLDEARQYNAKLTEELSKAQSDEDRQRLLVSMANAGMEENIPAILEYAQDKNPETRTTVAMALRKTQSEESERALLDLAGDGDRNVQNTSLLMLSKYRTRAEHLEEIRTKIENGTITENSYQMILTLLVTKLSTDQELVRDICRTMLEKGVHDNNLAQQIRELMER